MTGPFLKLGVELLVASPSVNLGLDAAKAVKFTIKLDILNERISQTEPPDDLGSIELPLDQARRLRAAVAAVKEGARPPHRGGFPKVPSKASCGDCEPTF